MSKYDNALALLTSRAVQVDNVVDGFWEKLLWQATIEALAGSCFLQYSKSKELIDTNVIMLTDDLPNKQAFDLLCAAAPVHAACVKNWFALPMAERPYRFFCQGAPSTCSACGAAVPSIVMNVAGQLQKNHCPNCGAQREDVRLVRDDWWANLAHHTGEVISRFDAVTTGVKTGLIAKLARFHVRGRIVAFADSDPARQAASSELAHILLDQFGDANRSTCYDAARMAVWEEHIKDRTGVDLQAMPFTMRSAALPALLRISGGDINLDVEDIDKITGSLEPYDEKLKQLRRLVRPDDLPRVAIVHERARAVRIVEGNDEFLLVELNGNQQELRSQVQIKGDLTVNEGDMFQSPKKIFEVIEEGA